MICMPVCSVQEALYAGCESTCAGMFILFITAGSTRPDSRHSLIKCDGARSASRDTHGELVQDNNQHLKLPCACSEAARWVRLLTASRFL